MWNGDAEEPSARHIVGVNRCHNYILLGNLCLLCLYFFSCKFGRDRFEEETRTKLRLRVELQAADREKEEMLKKLQEEGGALQQLKREEEMIRQFMQVVVTG